MNDNSRELKLQVVTAPDAMRDILVEIWRGDELLAEVYDDPGCPVVHFLELSDSKNPMKVEDLQNILGRAVDLLANRPRIDGSSPGKSTD